MADSIKNTESVDVVKRIPFGQGEALVFRSRTTMAFAAANAIASKMRQVASVKPTFRMIFAAAPSQSEVLNALTAIPNLPWEQVIAFHMDDYLGLPTAAPQRFANWLDDHLFSKVPLAEVHRIRASGAPDEICQTYADKLAEEPIDIICLGIGVNGHIAFNDPPADFDTEVPYLVVDLDQRCREQQIHEGWFEKLDEVPEEAISMSVQQIMSSKHLICTVPEARKAEAVQRALEGKVNAQVPASILQKHEECRFYLDKESSALLKG